MHCSKPVTQHSDCLSCTRSSRLASTMLQARASLGNLRRPRIRCVATRLLAGSGPSSDAHKHLSFLGIFLRGAFLEPEPLGAAHLFPHLTDVCRAATDTVTAGSAGTDELQSPGTERAFQISYHQRTFHSASQIASMRSVPHSCLHASVSAASEIQTRGSKKCRHARDCLPSKDGLQLAPQRGTGSGTGRV